jgi:hypothetical protein
MPSKFRILICSLFHRKWWKRTGTRITSQGVFAEVYCTRCKFELEAWQR